MNPSAVSGSSSRSRMSSIMRSSGTSSPLSRIGFTLRPSSVSCAIAFRSMSPVAMCGIPYSASIRFACVPFPDP
jgi:hypothetical protein